MKKRIVVLFFALAAVFIFSTAAYAAELEGLFGGLTSLLSAEEETYGVGEAVEKDDLSIKLINVMQSTGNSYYTPASGKEFLIFEFTIKNNSQEDLMLSTIMCFSAWCDDMLCELSIEALSTAMLSGKYQLDCVVEPGKSVTGVVGYEVPKKWEEVKVQFSKEALFGEKITFVVNNK